MPERAKLHNLLQLVRCNPNVYGLLECWHVAELEAARLNSAERTATLDTGAGVGFFHRLLDTPANGIGSPVGGPLLHVQPSLQVLLPLAFHLPLMLHPHALVFFLARLPNVDDFQLK